MDDIKKQEDENVVNQKTDHPLIDWPRIQSVLGEAAKSGFAMPNLAMGKLAMDLPKIDWSQTQSVLGEAAKSGFAMPNPAMGKLAMDLPKIDWSQMQSVLGEAAKSEFAMPNPAMGKLAMDLPKIDWPQMQSILGKAAKSGFAMPNPTMGKLAMDLPKIDWSQMQSVLGEAAKSGFAKPNPTMGKLAMDLPKIDWPKFQPLLSDSINLGSSFHQFEESLNLSQTLAAMNELSLEIQNETVDLEEAHSVGYSETDVQFILNSLEEWVSGEISFKSTVNRLKENKFAWWIVTGLMVNLFWNLLFVFSIIENHQIQQDRTVLENIQSYIDAEVDIVRIYKQFYINSEEWTTSQPIGITRKEVKIREGRSRKAHIVTDGIVGQKTIVFMFETRNNWRKVEVKMNGVYVQGWVPESTIIKLKKFQPN